MSASAVQTCSGFDELGWGGAGGAEPLVCVPHIEERGEGVLLGRGHCFSDVEGGFGG